MEQRDSLGDLGFMEPLHSHVNPQLAAPNPIGIGGWMVVWVCHKQ
jgi:hypothetical protein